MDFSFSGWHASDPARSHVRQIGTSIVRLSIPAAFVLCWSSGFVVPRAFAPYSEPLTFTAMRNGGAAAVLLGIGVLFRRPWPRCWRDQLGLLWSGALLQGVFLATIYWSIYHGLPTGIAALIGGLQPAITAVFAACLFGEMLTKRQWAGIALGFAGVALVISPQLEGTQAHLTLGLALLTLFGVASGSYASIYQKRFEQAGDLWTRTAILFVGALVPPLAGAFLFEDRSVSWSPILIGVYAWSVFALAIGATMALLHLIGQGQAARVASLIYLADCCFHGLRGIRRTNRIDPICRLRHRGSGSCAGPAKANLVNGFDKTNHMPSTNSSSVVPRCYGQMASPDP